ncbi:MAG TPA: hypothetical protein VHK91_01985, partial [Flavisolibacter sp.]|nr:hypothetical protein [Flavisolibacter sp.]
MERNFTDENFEQFLRQNADGLRMRPTDRVWKGIANDLNKRRRRIGWLMGSFLVGAALLGYLLVDTPAGRPVVSIQDRQHKAYPS